jgi:hypothetical protein
MKRWTNLALMVVLGGAFTTGWVAFFDDGAVSRWSLIIHAASGYAILALTPWKSVIAASGIRRRRPAWWLSLALTSLVLVSVLAGILESAGIWQGVGPLSAMEIHVGAALLAVPLVLWHILARHLRLRPLDLSRRNLLRSGVLAFGGLAAYASAQAALRLLQLPGAGRRFTGSYEINSLQPQGLPVTQWLFDSVPLIDPSAWQLEVRSRTVRRWSYVDLLSFDDRARATLDCTGGFYSTQDWSGVWLSRLLESDVSGSSIRVSSITGYERRFALSEAQRLLLATRLGGEPLPTGNGFPLRLVALDRRGYWWVKWVTAITVDDLPAWWQLPFPAQ